MSVVSTTTTATTMTRMYNEKMTKAQVLSDSSFNRTQKGAEKLIEIIENLDKFITDLGFGDNASEKRVRANKTVTKCIQNCELKSEYIAFLCVCAIIFAVGLLANLTIIFRVLRQGVLRARIRMLLFSLSVADTVFILLEFPLNQFTWMSTVFWTTGEFACRLSAFTRGFAAYLITFILVVISLDRCLNTVKPMAPKAASTRTRNLLFTAVFIAVICSLPQAFVFHLADVPHVKDRQQCVSKGLVDPNDNLLAVVYPLFTFVCLYIIPLVVISMAYTIILYATSSSATTTGKQRDSQQLILFHQMSQSTTMSSTSRSSNESYIKKAQMKTLRILFVTVAAFFLCWLPYYSILLFFVCNRKLATRLIPFWMQKLAELCAVSNACINPFIFGNYLLKIRERFRCWCKK